MSDLVERVKAERKMRGWSQRDAAAAGQTSNQTWSNFERSGHVTAAMQAAVILAFGWPANWSSEPPALPLSRLDELSQRLEQQATALLAILRTLRDLDGVDPEALPDDDWLMRSTGT